MEVICKAHTAATGGMTVVIVIVSVSMEIVTFITAMPPKKIIVSGDWRLSAGSQT